MTSIFEIDLLLALALVVVVPLGLSMIRWEDPQAERLRAMASKAAPYAGAASAVSLFTGDNTAAQLNALLASAWLAVSVVVGISALAEMVRTRPSALESYLPIAACIHLVIGAVWFVLFQSGVRPMDLPIELVEVTAVDFHYAGFAAPVLAAQAALWLRALPGKWNRLAAFAGLAVAVAVVMTAIGTGISPLIEFEGTLLMAVSLVAIAAGTTLIAFRLPVSARVPLLISSACVWVAMVLAVQYSFGRFTDTGAISVRDMARTHGALVFVFAVCGMLGWKQAAKKAKLVTPVTDPERAPEPEPPEERRPEESPRLQHLVPGQGGPSREPEVSGEQPRSPALGPPGPPDPEPPGPPEVQRTEDT
ncbi:MAG TPA: YndJ family transporter [Actinomycetota bacterium]|nr:YndJ family transporter [Actinomycetota bacterium]